MSEKIVQFRPVEVGEGYRLDPDQILEEAKGKEFSRLVILGQLPNGEIYVAGSANAGESLVLMELAKLDIIGK